MQTRHDGIYEPIKFNLTSSFQKNQRFPVGISGFLLLKNIICGLYFPALSFSPESSQADPELNALLGDIRRSQLEQHDLLHKTSKQIGCLYAWLILNVILLILSSVIWFIAKL